MLVPCANGALARELQMTWMMITMMMMMVMISCGMLEVVKIRIRIVLDMHVEIIRVLLLPTKVMCGGDDDNDEASDDAHNDDDVF